MPHENFKWSDSVHKGAMLTEVLGSGEDFPFIADRWEGGTSIFCRSYYHSRPKKRWRVGGILLLPDKLILPKELAT